MTAMLDLHAAQGRGEVRMDLLALLASRRDNRLSYSIAEVATMLGVSERAVLRRIASGDLPVIRTGSRTLIVKPQLPDAA